MKPLPPADLLKGISGVEEGLRDNKKLGRAGGVGLIVSVAQLALAQSTGLTSSTAGQWWAVLASFLLVGSVLLYVRSRVWLRSSSRPFRYTCSLADFVPLGKVTSNYFPEFARWMRFDLAKLLNDRLGRLSFLDAPQESAGLSVKGSTEHIHISGEFVGRKRRDNKWEIEVSPRVRVGGDGKPATLAPSVPFVCHDNEGSASKEDLLASGQAGGPKLERDDYEKILERTYYSLASEIYRQIRDDVQHKIDLLPTRRLRSIAYLREADDYAKSNTLFGLDSAITLYRSAMAGFDPYWRPRPSRGGRRALLRAARWRRQKARAFRTRLSGVLPALGKVEVSSASAEVGYANALLYRRTLAGMSGRRVNPIYEARFVAERAVERLEHLPDDVPQVKQARFDAYVCLALVWHQLDCPQVAQSNLDEAHSVYPTANEEDARYLYVQGLLEEQPSSALRFLRLAVEREPRFEAAQFELAYRAEMLWRTRPLLEHSVAALIQGEYEEILKLNPGNVAAWAHAAYIHWLRGDLKSAREYYERGRDFRERKRERAIAQLDYGLARIAAEEGDFEAAYRYYVSASSGQLLEGVSGWKSTSAQFYFFDSISPAMLRRYRSYLETSLGHLDKAPPRASDTPAEKRVLEIIRSFVVNDYGEACYSYHLRNYDPGRLAEAEQRYEEAKRLNQDATLPYYNLYLLRLFGMSDDDNYERDLDRAITELNELLRREPRWSDAVLASVAAPAEAASKEWSRKISARCAHAMAAEICRDGTAVTRLRQILPQKWLWSPPANGGESSGSVAFNWPAVASTDKEDPVHWERQFDDLQVEALLEWALIQIAASRVSENGAHNGRDSAQQLLKCIRGHFWPGDFRVLFASYQLDPTDDDARRGLCTLMSNWLSAAPAVYWALELATTDFLALDGTTLTLFDRTKRMAVLDAAINELRSSDTTSKLLEWAMDRRACLARTDEKTIASFADLDGA